ANNGMSDSIIRVERRGSKEDKQLLERWIKIYHRGTTYIDTEEMQKKITELKMHKKEENILGLQLADISASCLLRKFMHPDKNEDVFNSIKNKIIFYENECIGRGIKIFPSNSSYKKTISSLVEPIAD
ncbi:MAG: DUF3800 domain-containing protein, partial [Parcubacteria group bacterium]